jgi:hypothetical protein
LCPPSWPTPGRPMKASATFCCERVKTAGARQGPSGGRPEVRT